MSVSVVDTHAHLCSEAFEADRELVFAAARNAGVAWVLNVADSVLSSQEAAAWAKQASAIYATAGIHPHEANEWGDQAKAELESLLQQPSVVAIGEIGLDYHYDFTPRDVQRRVFRAQLHMAAEYGLPVVVHNREADNDTLAELRAVAPLRGVLHCFWADEAVAHEALSLGLYLGVGGPITFGNTEPLRQVIRQVPLERLVLETDSPYLAPKPFRGKRNEPMYVLKVAEALADLHQTTLEQVASITTHNAEKLFLRGRYR